MTSNRILPVVDDHDTGGFFEAAARGNLAVRWCPTCERALHLPRGYCSTCRKWSSEWREVAGTGTLYSWTVVHRQLHPAYEVPYTVVLVDLDDADGVRLVGNIAGRPSLTLGQKMEVWFDEAADGVVLPNWRPA